MCCCYWVKLADAGTAKSLHPCLLALVIREVDKATKGENGNDDVEHRSILFEVFEHICKSVIDTENVFSHIVVIKHDVAVQAIIVDAFGVD